MYGRLSRRAFTAGVAGSLLPLHSAFAQRGRRDASDPDDSKTSEANSQWGSSTPTSMAVTGVFTRWSASFTDSRKNPDITYFVRISTRQYDGWDRIDPMMGFKPPQTWLVDPEEYLDTEYGLSYLRAMSPAEYQLPDISSPPRHDALFRAKQGFDIGPCVVSSIGFVLVEQAAVASAHLRSGLSGVNSPADICIQGVLERVTAAGGVTKRGADVLLRPTEDELAAAGLVVNLGESYSEETL